MTALQFDIWTIFTHPGDRGILGHGLPHRKRINRLDERLSMVDVAKPRQTSADITSTPTPDQASDEQIMQQVTQGDAEALEMLYDRYAAAVMGMALKMLNGDRTTAEEIVQETFWRVWKRSGSFDAQAGAFSGWLFGITRNLCIDTWRRRKSRPQPVFGEDDVEQVKNQPDPAANVAEAVWTSIKHAHVKGAMNVLPEEQREVIELAYFWGLTRQEISETLGVPLGTVHTRARLALEKLRVALKRQGLTD